MNDSFGRGGFGGGFGQGSWSEFTDKAGQSLWDAVDQVRSTFEQKVAPRMGRGDVRQAILSLLQESPKHGYQLINEIAERSGGAWKPSPGSVYPTLQLLNDEGLIDAEESGGRKTYALTEVGRAEAESSEWRAPWQRSEGGTSDETGGRAASSSRHGALPKAGIELAQATAQVARSGSSEQVDRAVEVLEDARRALYKMLAES